MISTAECATTVRAMCDVLCVWALFLPGHPGFLDRHLVVDLLGTGGLPGEVGDLRPLYTGPRQVSELLGDDSNFVRVRRQRFVARDCLTNCGREFAVSLRIRLILRPWVTR